MVRPVQELVTHALADLSALAPQTAQQSDETNTASFHVVTTDYVCRDYTKHAQLPNWQAAQKHSSIARGIGFPETGALPAVAPLRFPAESLTELCFLASIIFKFSISQLPNKENLRDLNRHRSFSCIPNRLRLPWIHETAQLMN